MNKATTAEQATVPALKADDQEEDGIEVFCGEWKLE